MEKEQLAQIISKLQVALNFKRVWHEISRQFRVLQEYFKFPNGLEFENALLKRKLSVARGFRDTTPNIS